MGEYRGIPTYQRVYAELVRAAEYRGLTTYQHLAVIMDLPLSGNLMGKRIGQILGEIVDDEVAAGRPMLSAVVVGTNDWPGKPPASVGSLANSTSGLASRALTWISPMTPCRCMW